ncbi:MAG: protein-disulfide reductase DsbD family protein [Rickettsiales bacterium]
MQKKAVIKKYYNLVTAIYLSLLTCVFFVISGHHNAYAQSWSIPDSSLSLTKQNNVSARLVSESVSLQEGKKIRLGVILDAGNWHTYWKEPGDAGLPTEFSWTLPEGFSASDIDWPPPQKFAEGELTTYGYTGTTLLPVTITVPDKLDSQSYDITVKANWLACDKICIPESATLSINMLAGKISPSSNIGLFDKHISASSQTINNTQDSSYFLIITTIMLALAGGLILNIMPCVLPVLSLKALALAKKAGHKREHTIKYGVAYTLGILVSFATIAAILITLQHGGEKIGWGFQMQSPSFVGFLIYLLFLVGLNLSGMFHLPVLMGNTGNNLANENSVKGSFFTGILAAMVATPCTAPFMASAVGVALLLPAWAAMLVFLSLGFGLALPFLLISIFPSLLNFLPKPGIWMERFKEFLAFPMYASVIWLIWVLGIQTGVHGIVLILFGLLLIIFTIWIQKINAKCNIYHRSFFFISSVIMLTAILISLGSMSTQKLEYKNTIAYSEELFKSMRDDNKPVYLDVTAAWCITCQLNKKFVLDSDNINKLFKEQDVALMVADWTNRNPKITELLGSFGYNGVPLNVFYPANNGKPVILPQILSEEIVTKTIKENQ